MQIGTPQEELPELIIPSRLEAIEREQWSLAKRTCDYQRAYLGAPPPVSSTIPQMDGIMCGGFRPGVHFLGGTTGAGKTAFALYLASRIASCDDPKHGGRRCGVTIISLELSEWEVRARMGSRISYVCDELTPFRWADFEQLGFAAHRADEAEPYGWAVQDDPVMNADTELQILCPRIRIVDGAMHPSKADLLEIESEIEACGRQGGSFVIVDYLQCIDAGIDLDEQQAMKEAARGLNLAGIRAGVPVLAIAAVSREKGSAMRRGKEGERPSADVFRGSSWIEYTGLTAWALVRRDDAERSGDNVAVELHPVKNRRGACSEYVQLAYNGAYGQFTYTDTDGYGRVIAK